MGEKRPTNEHIHIGDIFEHKYYGTRDSSRSLYQVAGLRGKTLVELRGILEDVFLDEACDLALDKGKVKVRPAPDRFYNDEVLIVRVCSEPDEDGTNWLRNRGETSRVFGTYYRQIPKDKTDSVTGESAWYALASMEKQGRLPSWIKKEDFPKWAREWAGWK